MPVVKLRFADWCGEVSLSASRVVQMCWFSYRSLWELFHFWGFRSWNIREASGNRVFGCSSRLVQFFVQTIRATPGFKCRFRSSLKFAHIFKDYNKWEEKRQASKPQSERVWKLYMNLYIFIFCIDATHFYSSVANKLFAEKAAKLYSSTNWAPIWFFFRTPKRLLQDSYTRWFFLQENSCLQIREVDKSIPCLLCVQAGLFFRRKQKSLSRVCSKKTLSDEWKNENKFPWAGNWICGVILRVTNKT